MGSRRLMRSLRYQHPERTLTSDAVQASVEDVVGALREAGPEIRGQQGANVDDRRSRGDHLARQLRLLTGPASWSRRSRERV